jgi:hypothetical protein
MNCCERTLVTLACVAGMSKEPHIADVDSVIMVIDEHGASRLCDKCAATADVLKSVIYPEAAIKPAMEQVSREYAKALSRADGFNDIQKRQMDSIVVDCINHHLRNLGPQ